MIARWNRRRPSPVGRDALEICAPHFFKHIERRKADDDLLPRAARWGLTDIERKQLEIVRAALNDSRSPQAGLGGPSSTPSDALLTWARRFVTDADANNGCPPNTVSGDSLLDVCRALLAASPSPPAQHGKH